MRELSKDSSDDITMSTGTWRGTFPDAKSVRVSCPGCGSAGYLNHDVAADGTVTPSLVCPHSVCGFHEYVRLVGWTP